MDHTHLAKHIDRVEKKLDGFMQGSAVQAANTTAELREISVNLKRVCEQVEAINAYLHVGNGKPPVNERLSLLEHEVVESKVWRSDHDDREEQLADERAKEARAARNQFTGIVLGGLFSLAAASVALFQSFTGE